MALPSAKKNEGAANHSAPHQGVQGRIGDRAGRACLVAVLLLTGLAATAQAQLSSQDIAALRERGQAEGWTFTVGENEATRRPLHELCGLVEPPDWQLEAPFDPCAPTRTLPAAFDWRALNGCTPIRNQAGCGSCWAFSAIGAMESAILIHDGVSRDLAEQWLVSCTGAGSCSGGWHDSACRYLSCNDNHDPCGDGGAVLEPDFPYVAWDAPCNCPYWHPYCLHSWAHVGSDTPSVSQIKQAILEHGPVSACVYVNSAFHGYTGGVFNACEVASVNHAIVLVGWDDNQGANGVWILRNSWGTGWGEGGYMRIQYGCSMVGYAALYVRYSGNDCNSNGIPDAYDIDAGTSQDCNNDSIPDECELVGNDCNHNSIPDDCETDCQANGIPDDCDIIAGTSRDCTGNGIPDECEADCNQNGVRDDCDISAGSSADCNDNAIPDECDIAAFTSPDCNSNAMPDECDVAAAVSADCNSNGIPDECDVEICYPLWDGFQPNPPFSYGRRMGQIDYNGDGLFWTNPIGTAVISPVGCQTQDFFDNAVKVTVPSSGDPELGYVTSEYFRTNAGLLPGTASRYTLRFQSSLEQHLNPETDWQFWIHDADYNKKVILLHFASTVSNLVGAANRGYVLVKNPAGSPTYLNTGVRPTLYTCYDFEVTLDNAAGLVQLYIDGQPRLDPPVAVLESGARRMDYFGLQAIANGAVNGASTVFSLDAFELCVRGGAAVPAQVYDCNANGTLDECDVVAGTSRDCDSDGVPDECQVFGDFDRDGAVDLTDYAAFSGCITGPDGQRTPECVLGDFDCDEDVDLDDFIRFQAVLGG
ncbi:MAG: C1 family peptidase [Planctomycetota bacterium]